MHNFSSRLVAGYLAGASLTIAAMLALDIGGIMTALRTII